MRKPQKWEKTFWGTPGKLKRPGTWRVKPSITLVLVDLQSRDLIYFFCCSTLDTSLSHDLKCHLGMGDVNEQQLLRKTGESSASPAIDSVRPALCPQITSLLLSAKCLLWAPLSLKAHGDRKLSGLSYFWVRKDSFLCEHKIPSAPPLFTRLQALLFPKSNLLMPDLCFKSFCSLLIVSEINE